MCLAPNPDGTPISPEDIIKLPVFLCDSCTAAQRKPDAKDAKAKADDSKGKRLMREDDDEGELRGPSKLAR
jgi:hypothetical protein